MAEVNESSITIQFTVSEISKLTSVESRKVFLYGIPWQVEVRKGQNGTQNNLAVYLFCVNEDQSSNWTAVACVTVKLLPFSDDQQAVEKFISPNVFDRINDGLGTIVLIQWENLFDANKKYVKDDRIKLEVKIEAENPNSLNRSIMEFECIDKACDCCCQATFQLTVMNVSNLMAVRSPQFIMRGLPWHIVVFKNTTHLGVFLRLAQRSGNASCEVTMTAKLVSSKGIVNPIEKSQKVKWPGILYIRNITSWEEMLKPENAFVNDDTITLNIEIKTEKPEGNVPEVEAKRRRFECSICLKDIGDQDVSATPCGHLYCTACIKTALRNRAVCPLCQKTVRLNSLKPMFLSAAK